MEGALDDIRVVELANWVAGPSCAALMADMGADVVKVEPLGGDGMRGQLRQPRTDDAAVVAADVPFQLDNRGKRSIAVDLGRPEGAALVRRLVAGADVVVTNLLPGRLARYGLAPDDLLAADPRLVGALVSGFGTEGDDADRPGFDLTAFFARGALMSLVGEPGTPPPAFRPGQGDHPTGLALLSAVLAALRVRDRTGRGQVVETALLRTAAWSIGCDVAPALVDHRQPTPRGRLEAISPMNTRYRCADGVWVNLSAADQRRWPGFCEAIGRPDLGADPRYDTPAKRFQAGAALIGLLDEVFASATFAEWAPRLDRSGVVWEKVAGLPDLVADPQAEANGMFATVDDPVAGSFRTLAAPFRMHGSEVAVRGPGPAVGAHTDAVLAELGLDAAEVDTLVAGGVVGRPPD